MLGIMVFSVIVWATTAISYPVSAGVIIALMAVLIGFAPNPATGKIFGTAAGLGMGLKGFSTTAFCLVAAAMFLATAMTKTGLDKRIALVILSKLGAKANRVVIGVICCGFRSQLGVDISWLDWFIAAAPFAVLMSFALYHVMMFLMPPEIDEIPGGQQTVKKLLHDMGKITKDEIKLLCISICLLVLWTTEKKLHVIDTSTSTIVAISILMLPKIGVMQWEEVVHKINWGTVVLFGVGISLGNALLSTKAATWLANVIVNTFDLSNSTTIMVLAIMALFLIIVHMGFASATGLAAAIIPIIISVLQQLKTPGVNVIGMTMILQYVVSFGFILPVNAPQNMIAYGTNTFEVRDFVRCGIPLTIIGFCLIMLLGMTYWKWLGLV